MRTTQQFSITLPTEMAEAVRAKVAAGQYATESEVIRDGLRVLLARDQAVESWLLGEVAAAYDALKAEPSRAISAAKLRARLADEQKKRLARSEVVLGCFYARGARTDPVDLPIHCGAWIA